ncbi:MAG: tetratricopeptide repeat protein [Leptospirales bacterium]
MTRFLLLVLLLSLVFIVKLFEWNPGTVTFQFLPNHPLTLPEVTLFVLALGMGAGFVMLIHGMGDLLKWIRNLREVQEEKREEKVAALWKKVREELNRSHTPQALSLLERLVSIYPNHTEALLLLGNLKRSMGDLTGAIRLHRRARVFDEEDVRILVALAQDYARAGRSEDELALYGEYFRKKEGRNVDILGMFRSRLFEQEKWDEALEVQSVLSRSFQKGERRDHEVAILIGIKYETGKAQLSRGDTDAARRSFRSALKIDPSFRPARIGLAEAQAHEGRVTEAFATLEEGYRRDRELIYLERLEEMALETGSPDRILSLFEKAVAGDPKNSALLYARARLFDRLMLVDSALELMESLEGTENWEGAFYGLLGDLYLRKDDQINALESFRKGAHGEASIGRYVCRQCEVREVQWSGRCPSCNAWGTMTIHPGFSRAVTSPARRRSDQHLEGNSSLSDPTWDSYSLGQST